MEFFDKLGKKASEAYKFTADKTGKIAKETKIKLKMNELKSPISEFYEEIGKKVYEKHVREDYDIKNELEELCTKIDVLSDEIEELLKQSLELKDKKQCPKCYAKLEKDDKFCPKCGEKQETGDAKDVTIVKETQNEQCECFDLEKTVEVESNSKIEEGENVQHIEPEQE